LKWLNDNFHQSNCFNPKQIYAQVHTKISTEGTVESVCRRLHTMKLIDEITVQPGDPNKKHSCYKISQLGIDELTPNTREKKMYKIAIIGMAAAIIAAITSIISIFT